MTRLVHYSDHVVKGKWARLIMNSCEPCFIAIGPRSLVIKKSKTGVVGRRLLEVRSLAKVENIARVLVNTYSEDLTPEEITNALLKPIVNAALHCQNIDEVLQVVSSAQ